ncbi:Hypothetical predicted protein [Prunus dulcis]|uniref:Subtilase family protein n=1 Tax=Prunus dulcis TaxID=3755 RepID=A0A5E4FQP5_PRUDU|nr:Hypothetical predicted protein [Prunus dulcis]
MGLNEKVSRNSVVESDIIVGVIDTGIWPESESFKDDGFCPPPKSWKGVCDGGKNFTCNNKIIGARRYTAESARDELGHGTHTASTVAENAVKDVNFYGLANGTAGGGVPAVRIVAYKVWGLSLGYNVLAAFDDAIADGVNIISVSMGTVEAGIDDDPVAIAWPMNGTSNNASTGAFAYGSGHINPVNAINPGLVYEASEEDYIRLLCTIYDEGKVGLISGDNRTCPTGSAQGYVKDHNYPSMGAKVEPMKPFSVNFHRRVKKFGLANSTYKATIFSNSNADIKVVPEVLSFQSLDEEKDFDVTVARSDLPDGAQVSGSLVWFDGTHRVRSPNVVYAYIQHEHQNMVT